MVPLYEDHFESGLVTIEFHLLHQLGKDLKKFWSRQSLVAAPYENFTVVFGKE